MGQSKKSSGNWLVTYSDLVTLLLVFFVLLYMLTSGVDQAKFESFVSYFQSSVGIMKQDAAISQQSNQSSTDQKIQQIINRWLELEKMLEKHGLSSEVDIRKIPEGMKITLSDSLTFMSGSSELLPAAQMVLGEVAQVISFDDVQEVEVLGHTDNVPIAERSYYRTNWHLGAARAVTVVQFVKNRASLDAGMFKASSYGEYKPVSENITEEGRRKNRRVEIYVRYKSLVTKAEPVHLSWESDTEV